VYFVYILYSPSFDRFYIGQTQDMENRLKRHSSGIEKATAPFSPWELKLTIKKNTRGEAMILERKLKNLVKHKYYSRVPHSCKSNK
jgi:putative endonuclease